MFKKFFSIVAILCIVSLLNISVFAADADKIDKTKPIITITKPSSDSERSFSKDYTICGITDLENIRIELYKRNSDGSFTEFKGTDGQSAWDIGPSGLFSIDVSLSTGYKSNTGINNFKIKAFNKTKPEINFSICITVNFIDANKFIKSENNKDYSLNKYFKH